ncbi:FkbM family methyltransferase [Azospirillum agricola]|uniref:FkbM family methyltransferase n=1 Tax=Azospirillum agricola TaxID=1720247 RepID=UPI000A1C8983|nr:FkbM family methyltransferase [Azospirillum agricola]
MSQTVREFAARIHDLVASGDGERARSLLVEAVARRDALALCRVAGLLLIQYGHYSEPALIPGLEAVAAVAPQDTDVLRALATALWVRDQRAAERVEALDAARRLVAANPEDSGALHLLGMIALTKRQFLEAYLAFSTGMTATPPLPLDASRRLAGFLLRGIRRLSFPVDGLTYEFGLAVHTPQAMESSVAHCAGQLTEMEELRYLKTVLGRAPVIAEVGVLLGNHSAFFLKNLSPRTLHLFEADVSCLEEIRENARANNAGGADIHLHHAFIGDPDGEPVEIGGTRLPQSALSSLVAERVDFLKVDTDGGEMGFLAGAEGLIQTSRPFVMMETDTVTDRPVRAWFAARGYEERHRIDHGHYFNTFFAPAGWVPPTA